MNYCKRYNIDLSDYYFDKIISEHDTFNGVQKRKLYKHKSDDSYSVTTFGTLNTNNYSVEYRKNEKLHRTDGPAFLEIKNGKLKMVAYFVDDNFHRENGPSNIAYLNNHNIIEGWNINGKLCRFDGPAFAEYLQDGTILSEDYYLFGKYYTKKAYWKLIDSIKNNSGRGISNCKEKKLKMMLPIAKYYNREDLVDKINNRLLILKLEKQ